MKGARPKRQQKQQSTKCCGVGARTRVARVNRIARGDQESKTLGQPGRGGGEFGEGGDGARPYEVEGRKQKQGGRGGHGGGGRARMINATINYLLNACNRFRGCGGGKDGRAARIRMSAPDLSFEIRRPSWVRMKLALAATTTAAPIRHPNPWGGCWEGIGAAGEGKGAATMCFHCHHAHVTRF